MSERDAASGTPARKDAHLALCTEREVEHRRGSLLDQVHLLHDSLPELAISDVDLSLELFGRRLQAPIAISGMSGGTANGRELNRALATAAQKFGLAMGVGSQRAMLEQPELVESFRVRDVAPDILLLANLGCVQARDAGVARVAELVEAIRADAICIHLNPAQELVQDEGDRDFRGCLDAIAELVDELHVPIVVKETGCGLSPATLARLASVGVEWVDTSGAGGTTWTGIESMRGGTRQQALGAELREWGIPTAASITYARRAGLRIIASGGIRTGLDAARAIALGAHAVGLALPFLRAFASGGVPEVLNATAALVESLRSIALLVGAASLDALRAAPRVLGAELRSWID
ncbi:MAG TPA: type 2 isopentenyl-diphosphate Delta-isomerase [Myxococcota bacterium]|nr:type 2 isopentenyl-diphosphate Delta-isomerase [Myxococcota bacterium]